ncbi:SAM-dependent methyltransferase [candidate division KSB1 bacterium]|nr:SAM-dependent methyltransferase [candidate division KSB1 bacterium]
MTLNDKQSGSFRDPSGFLFFRDGLLYRQVNTYYKENYDFLIGSGLYDKLVKENLLIPHEEADPDYALSGQAYKVIKPDRVPFISYPYEWCFSQLKDAALTTLKIQKIALDYGMSLKDCSAYNIQFYNGKPVFIDTLSFEKYKEGEPWVAYRQFCQHFLAPLALMKYKDVRLNQLFRIYIDGVPLDLAASLLPFRTRFSFSLLSHIHIHAKSQKHYADKAVKPVHRQVKKFALLGLVDNLQTAVNKITWKAAGTEWGDYYQDTNYSSSAQRHKMEIIKTCIEKYKPRNVWDLGANNGFFSRIASDSDIPTIAFDIDPVAVELDYLECRQKKETQLLPLLLDLTNPSPGIGWKNKERMSFIERGPADMVMALALIHHLAISNNVPLINIAEFFHNTCKTLIIEFVPKNDSQVQRLLATREDIFPHYTQQDFEKNFSGYFDILESHSINESERTLYLLQRKAI